MDLENKISKKLGINPDSIKIDDKFNGVVYVSVLINDENSKKLNAQVYYDLNNKKDFWMQWEKIKLDE